MYKHIVCMYFKERMQETFGFKSSLLQLSFPNKMDVTPLLKDVLPTVTVIEKYISRYKNTGPTLIGPMINDILIGSLSVSCISQA